MPIEVTRDVIAAIAAEASSAQPLECCGILLGDGTRITSAVAARNVHPAPDRHFEIDPQALIDAHRNARKGGPQVLGYYHSHPAGPPEPSTTDCELSAGDGSIWAIHGIAAGEWTIRMWRAVDGGFEPLFYREVEG